MEVLRSRAPRTGVVTLVAALVVAGVLSGCGGAAKTTTTTSTHAGTVTSTRGHQPTANGVVPAPTNVPSGAGKSGPAARVPAPLPLFRSDIRPVPVPLETALKKHLWHRGCPTPLSDLRVLSVRYVGFDRRAHPGELVVNADAAHPLQRVFSRLYQLRFRIGEMQPLADVGDNTAAFECRDAASSPCPGTPPTHSWSEHAYGEAVDLDPIENPYTGCGSTRVKASVRYLNRSHHRTGMVTPAVVRAFASIGWGWGGSWSGTKDYMHFSATGH